MTHFGIRIANCGLTVVITKSVFRNPQLTPLTLIEAINIAEARLAAAGITNARLDAEILLSHILKKDRTWLITNMHDILDGEAGRIFQTAFQRRSQREPLQYIIGKQEFWGLEFTVTPDVLIPRPETELIVETAIGIMASPSKQAVIVDLGTGSGCIAISLAKELQAAHFYAIDKSEKTLAVARENAARHGVLDRIRFINGDLFQPLEELDIRGQIDIIVSNPPYVRLADCNTLQPEVSDYEPKVALVAGPIGTEIHRRIISVTPEYLKRQGSLVMEMGIGQADVLLDMVAVSGAYAATTVLKDLAGIQRVLVAKKT